MRTTTIRAAVAAGVLLLAGACTDDGPAPVDPTSSWSPTGTIDPPSPSSSAGPVEPTLPDAAREASEAGARAFIEYYWELVNYAQVTGDVKALRKASGKTCGGCTKGIAAVEDLYGAGGRAEGGEYKLTITRIKPIEAADRSLHGCKARFEVRNAEQTIMHGDGRREVMTAATTNYLSYLIWLDGAWRMDVLEPQ
ncbi:DUF6318 family protein [Nocardioides nitrophenolicus]|uniref:DUF6318 family protein n=1 Tax=Nocardioides nitrophenolicus TaxID=60489 RepID=UPI0019563A21|nr:DUF6318 family protein [Nocardioides nitrophenolicus]MBM7520067.1 hypothetical protein [Nocardioides nitrophenolicus]